MVVKRKEPITKQESEYNTLRKHKDEIRDAANDAKTIIAAAASDASKVIADAAAVSVKVLSIKNADDHDLLIKLNTLMDGLKEDIRDLKSGTTLKIENHDSRIKILENKTANYTITLSLYTLAVVAMISLTIYHILHS